MFVKVSNFITKIFDWLTPFFILGIRIYLARIFLWSGYLKLTNWTTTVYSFKTDFKTGIIPPDIAAILGTGAEILFPILLLIGFGARIPALCLFIFNFLSVIFYPMLLLPEYACALKDHILWGVLILIPLFYGHGKISLDYLLQQKVNKEYQL
jgi:putative oxidoreductase